PTAATPRLPVDSPDDFEASEGMRVVFEQDLTISEYFNFDRFGEIVLTVGRQFQPTAIHEPGSPEAAALADSNQRSRRPRDGGMDGETRAPARPPTGDEFDLENLFRGGDIVSFVTGVMGCSFGLYGIQPTQGAVYTPGNPTQPDAREVGDLVVAS